ncbi:MAG: N-acetylneuraminate synthase family protein [Proteobacteria bacterium]|nr:N-acetylneuraminate synthase family protein [Pseudomonadota bacterium]MBU4288258.1 N-acetylneuraminate synthase family protein [Pseudomonadota bacterium]MCG2756950.1 N-acetylneuraminate synthase family protein [Desulfobacteraceae bacterium]
MGFLDNRQDPYFIAEIGSNHLNNFEHTVTLIEELSRNGANGIKFQLFTSEGLYSRNTPVFPGEKEMPYDIAKGIELPRAWLRELKSVVEKNGADFICSPFSLEDIEVLKKLDVCSYKIASSEINDVILIKHIAMTKKPIFLSVGMSNLADIELALETIHKYGPCEVFLLQCTSLYPTPPEEVNLNVLKTLEMTFGCKAGLSDHTLGTHIPLAAVAIGARIIEKHVTMNRDAEGPDHFFALLPEEFGNMVTWAREIKMALGSFRKIIADGELAKRDLSRRSIVTKEKILKGELLSQEKLTTKRPGYGIAPTFMSLIVGRSAKRDIPEDEVVRWEDILD